MLNFEKLIIDTSNMNQDECRAYLEEFFKDYNSNDYLINELANKEEKEDIYSMFDVGGDVEDRANEILSNNPYCLEAFFVFYKLSNDVVLDYYFNSILNNAFNYSSLSPYKQYSYIFILNSYVEFLFSVHNYTASIRVMNVIKSLDKDSDNNLTISYVYAYSQLERLDLLYEMYLNNEFNSPLCYLYLIVVCLKHNDELKGKEVLNTLIDNYPKASYIDHIWDLEGDDSDEAFLIKQSISHCYESICSVPFFFSWCEKNKESVLLS